MLWLQQRPITFVPPIILTLPQQDFIKDKPLKCERLSWPHWWLESRSCDFLCRYYLLNRDTFMQIWHYLSEQANQSKSYVQYRADRVGGVQKGGIIMFVNQQIHSTRLNIQIPGLEFLATSLSPTPNRKIVLITLYRRSSTVSTQQFIAMVETITI